MSQTDFQRQHEEARQFLIANDFAQALARYEKLSRLAPGNALIWFEYGNAASRKRQLDLADRAWRRALELAGRDAELINLVGHQYQAARLPDRARACFAQAAAADPRGINPRISLAVLSEQQHFLEMARAAVDECLRIDSQDDQARYFSAVLDRREGQFERAESRLGDLIATDSKQPYVRFA